MKVTKMQTRAFWKGEFRIDGLVEDQEITYKVSLENKGSRINSYSCSCANGHSYKEMCPHEKALYQHYLTQARETHQQPVSTSSQVRTMIREYTNREVAEIVREQKEEQVEFVPRILMGRQDIRVEFKIGRDRQYVVKDLAVFARNVEQGAYVEYGKTLAFYHNLDVFSEKSRKLVLLVMEMMDAYQEHFKQFQRGTLGTAPAIRELVLSHAGRDRFFELLEGMTLEAEDVRGVRRELLVCRENPELIVTVRPEGRQGLKVSLDKKYSSFSGEKYLYVCDGQKLYLCQEEFGRDLRVFLEQMTQGYGAPYEVLVNEKDVPLFYERVLRKIEVYGILDVKDVDLEAVRPVELKARFEFESPEPGEMRLHPTLSYGDYSFHPVEDEHVPKTICRDVPGEFRVSQVITRYFKHRDGDNNDLVIKNDEDAIYDLLSDGIEEFRQLGEVYLPDEFRHLRILHKPKVSVGVNTMGDWLELNIDMGELSSADIPKILEAYRQKKAYYRLKSGEFLRLEENGILTVARMIDGLTISKKELESGQIRVPKYRALYLDSVYREFGGIQFDRDQKYKSVIRTMKSIEDSDFEIPGEFRAILRGYQKTGFRWLKTLDACGFGGILADDMGLGKTIQVISLLYDEQKAEEKKPSLIICPASMVYNWESEFERFAPSIKVCMVAGTAQEREAAISHLAECDVAVTSYDLLKRDIALYQKQQFRYQIIDEAQYIKNPMTQGARAVKAIQSECRFALTGTPVENRLSELWSIFDYLMPGFLYTYDKFKKRYESPIVKDQDEEALGRLQRMTAPFILRRLKSDVLKELPEKLETVIYSKMEKEQQELYTANAWQLKEHLDDGNKIQILSALTRLRQICCDPHLIYENYKGQSAKLDTCMELILSGVEAGHKILLFSQFTSMLELIGARMKKEGISYYQLTGETSKEDRLKLVQAFHKDETPVFLISLKAGGTGLNLTAADMVIHYDPWWNVAAQNQATDRAYRIGQEKQVSVFKLITRDTIEENILKLQESKRLLADQIVSEGMVSLGSLSHDQLKELLG